MHVIQHRVDLTQTVEMSQVQLNALVDLVTLASHHSAGQNVPRTETVHPIWLVSGKNVPTLVLTSVDSMLTVL